MRRSQPAYQGPSARKRAVARLGALVSAMHSASRPQALDNLVSSLADIVPLLSLSVSASLSDEAVAALDNLRSRRGIDASLEDSVVATMVRLLKHTSSDVATSYSRRLSNWLVAESVSTQRQMGMGLMGFGRMGMGVMGNRGGIDTGVLNDFLTDASRPQIQRRAAMVAAGAFRWGIDGALAASCRVLSDPFPCRLSTQDLVELLKMPTCIGAARRVVLDHLGNRYGRRFANHWAFVRFAREQKLNLDFTTPPKRPEAKEAGTRVSDGVESGPGRPWFGG